MLGAPTTNKQQTLRHFPRLFQVFEHDVCEGSSQMFVHADVNSKVALLVMRTTKKYYFVVNRFEQLTVPAQTPTRRYHGRPR